jgi:putative MATE family efflux protein
MNSPSSQNKLDPRALSSIWLLAWPVLINIGSHTLFSVVDLYWVHTLGTEAVAAVALDGNIIFCMFALTQIMYTGSLAMVSRRVGAETFEGSDGAASITSQAFQLSLLLGLAIAGAGALLSTQLIALFEVNSELGFHAESYLRPMMWSFLPLFPSMVIAAVFSACGDTRTPMYIAVFCNLLNAVLDPFLIFGWAGLPVMGVEGAGIASLICQSIGLALNVVAFGYRKLPFLKQSLWQPATTKAWLPLLKIGVPSGAAAITRPLSTLFLLKIIAEFGSEGVAAFGITIRALSFIWLYHGALSTAVSTLTGQSLGKDDMEGIVILNRQSIVISLATSVIFGAVYFIFATEIISLFEAQNQLVLELGTLFLQLLVIANLFSAPAVVWHAILIGAGETRSPMRIAIYANWLLKLPLAWVWAIHFNGGIEGIWYAMFLSIVYEDFAIYLAYKKGQWKRISV